MNRDMVEINVNDVVVKARVRDDNGDLVSLSKSIRKLGLLSPVVIDKNNVLISGGRRLEACRSAGVSRIPALKVDIDYHSMTALDIQSDENLCRKALSEEELKKHIQSKKSIASGRASHLGQGVFSRIKKLFLRG